MKLDPQYSRMARRLRHFMAVGVLVTTAGVAATSMFGPSRHAAAASEGTLTVVDGDGNALSTGDSATPFMLTYSSGMFCSSDTVSGYKTYSYVVPSSVDPGTLHFGSWGPTPSSTANDPAGVFIQPLFSSTGSSYSAKNTGLDTGSGGLLMALPTSFDFNVWVTGDIAPGTYNVGFACYKQSGSVFDKYWNVQITFEADNTDTGSAGVRWAVGTNPPSSTTTTTGGGSSTTAAGSSTTAAGSSTTAAGSSTTAAGSSTTDGGSSTTAAGSSTTAGGSSTTAAGSSSTDSSSTSSSAPDTTIGGTTAFTGASIAPYFLIALFVFFVGETVLVVRRPTRVKDPDDR